MPYPSDLSADSFDPLKTLSPLEILKPKNKYQIFVSQVGDLHRFLSQVGDMHRFLLQAGDLHRFLSQVGDLHKFLSQVGDLHRFLSQAGDLHRLYSLFLSLAWLSCHNLHQFVFFSLTFSLNSEMSCVLSRCILVALLRF